MNISVIIPVYNAASYLKKAVKSALEQKEVAEILLIEDGSEDDSLEICQRLEKEYEGIILLRHPNGENRGAGASRNLGIENASGEYVAFLDADDYYLPERFKNQLILLEGTNEFDGTFSAIKAEFENDKLKSGFTKSIITCVSKEYSSSSKDTLNAILEGKGFIHLNSLLIRRVSLGTEIRFDNSFRQAQDADFLYHLLSVRNLKSANPNEIVAIRYVHSANRIHDVKRAHYYSSLLSAKWIANKDFSEKISPAAFRKLFYRKYAYGDHSNWLGRSASAFKDYFNLSAVRRALSLIDLLYLIRTDFK